MNAKNEKTYFPVYFINGLNEDLDFPTGPIGYLIRRISEKYPDIDLRLFGYDSDQSTSLRIDPIQYEETDGKFIPNPKIKSYISNPESLEDSIEMMIMKCRKNSHTICFMPFDCISKGMEFATTQRLDGKIELVAINYNPADCFEENTFSFSDPLKAFDTFMKANDYMETMTRKGQKIPFTIPLFGRFLKKYDVGIRSSEDPFIEMITTGRNEEFRKFKRFLSKEFYLEGIGAIIRY